jgi:murein DD-endopeptidase MepM/ murein hydrolase activator NlpD
VSLLSESSLLGSTAEISIGISDEKSGIQDVQVYIVQGQKRFKIHQRTNVRQSYLLTAGPKKLEENFSLDTGTLGFDDGRADIQITARDFSFWHWMRGNETTTSYPVVLDTKVPKIWIVDSPDSMKAGSSGIVVYRVSEPIARHGIEIDGYFHPGFSITARGENVYGALIAVRYDAESVKKAAVHADDKAGNEGSVGFGIRLRKTEKKLDRIDVSEGFLAAKIPEFSQYYPEMEKMGGLLEQYLYVNNEVRQKNALRIQEYCQKSSPERMWEGAFKRMRRSSRRAGFAEYRSYYYDGKKIDNQVHLGVDLASVRQADVEAANRGVVVAAEYLGIYGNMVIVDHGLGVFTLYSHMSQILAKVGDQVEKSTVLGNTGITGMAGGDHLHFSVLINGIFVNPLEWWDKSWLDLHILNYLSG